MKKLLLAKILIFGFLTGLSAQSSFDRIEFTDIHKNRLYVAGFSLDGETNIHIEAVGAGYEDFEFNPRNIHSDPSGLYAYGWIINSDTRKMVWRMTNKNSRRVSKEGTYEFSGDVSLPEGSYEVYYYFNEAPFYQSRSFWNLGRFLKKMLVESGDSPLPEQKSYLKITGFDASESEPIVLKEIRRIKQEDAVFNIEAKRPHQYTKQYIKVSEKTDISIYAIGELSSRKAYDYGWIKNNSTGKKIWVMRPGEGSSAGGAFKNRFFRGDLTLDPGMYEIVFTTDGSHQMNGWNSNPPFDPYFYGITIFASPQEKEKIKVGVGASEKLIAQIVRVGDYADKTTPFKLDKPARVKIVALGEGDDGEMYDYGWLTDSKGATIWKMTYYKTTHAGGAEKNRSAFEILRLSQGDYYLHYKSDDTHSWDDWNAAPPEESDLWGISVYYLEDVSSPNNFQTGNSEASKKDLIVDLTRVGSEQKVKKDFKIEKTERIKIEAVGEGSRGKMYDYGWIVSLDNHIIVWKMNYEETIPAGGSKKNRMVETEITLPPGNYQAVYETDDSHAYDDWNAKPPNEPENWGIKIYRPEK